jgi:hypothetical protein
MVLPGVNKPKNYAFLPLSIESAGKKRNHLQRLHGQREPH